MRRLILAILAMVCVVVVGCGSPESGEPPVAEEEEPQQPRIDLTIEVSEGKGTPSKTWTLRCDPNGGDHPDVDAACDVLADTTAKKALGPIPEDQPCTMIYGGPQTARITGTWDGEQVDAELARTNGCEIDQWANLEPVVPAAGGPG
jgi:Subtilisin inhibitor-like